MLHGANKNTGAASPVYRRTFVLTDQHFVAAAPSSTRHKQCLKIIRIKNATLWDLFNYFSDFILDRDLELPDRSTVLLGSASHLANVGPAFYTEELVQVNQHLYQMFEVGISFIPCPPMLIDGTSNSHLVRAIVELSA